MKNKPVEYTLEQVLVCAVCEISVNGWVSSKDAKTYPPSMAPFHPLVTPMVSTKEKVRLLLQTDLDSSKVARKDLMFAAEEISLDLFGDPIKEEVQAAIEWAKNLLPGPTTSDRAVSDYDIMIAAIAIDGIVGVRQLGFAVSIIQSYRQQHDHQKYPKSEWVGNLRAPIECDVTVVSVKESPTQGEWWLVTVKTVDGNSLKWFAKDNPILVTRPVTRPLRANDKINIKGIVVRHEDWKGYKTTKLKDVFFGVQIRPPCSVTHRMIIRQN